MRPKTPWTSYIKPVLWAIVAIYVVVFVFLNTTIVTINFLFFKTEVALIFVLIGMALIGAGLCGGVVVGARRRAAKKAQLTAAVGNASAPAAKGKK